MLGSELSVYYPDRRQRGDRDRERKTETETERYYQKIMIYQLGNYNYAGPRVVSVRCRGEHLQEQHTPGNLHHAGIIPFPLYLTFYPSLSYYLSHSLPILSMI